MRASELADALGLSKGRISQLVAGGTLEGCFSGDGRDRVFDLEKCAKALNKRLDPGQMLGNGAETKRRLRELERASAPGFDLPLAPLLTPRPAPKPPSDGAELGKEDPDRYELARTAKAEQELRGLMLKNGREEGLYVLSSEVTREVARAIAQEVREVETFIGDAARALADKMGVDFKEARQILRDGWRAHRGNRAAVLSEQAETAEMTAAEIEADI